MSDIVEAMARGMWRWKWRAYMAELQDDDAADRMWRHMTDAARDHFRDFARAAIRAAREAGCPVVERMPEPIEYRGPIMESDAYRGKGYNAALALCIAALRARAAKEPTP